MDDLDYCNILYDGNDIKIGMDFCYFCYVIRTNKYRVNYWDFKKVLEVFNLIKPSNSFFINFNTNLTWFVKFNKTKEITHASASDFDKQIDRLSKIKVFI